MTGKKVRVWRLEIVCRLTLWPLYLNTIFWLFRQDFLTLLNAPDEDLYPLKCSFYPVHAKCKIT